MNISGKCAFSLHHQFAFILCCAMGLFSAEANAKASSDECEKHYSQLSKKHNDALTNHSARTPGFFKSVHGVENDIFTAFQSCPKDPLLFSLMGQVQLSLGNVQLASLYATRAHNWNPDVWQTNHLLATTLLIQEKRQKALPYLQKAADLAEHKAELHFNLCNAYFNANEFEKTISSCSRLLELENHNLHGEAYHLRAQAHQAMNKNTLATRDFDKARDHGVVK